MLTGKTGIFDKYSPIIAIFIMTVCFAWVMTSLFGFVRPCHVSAGDWFSSSGAVLTLGAVISEFMLSRWSKNLKREDILVGASTKTIQVKQTSTMIIEVLAFCFMIIGTFIWAYGSYVIK